MQIGNRKRKASPAQKAAQANFKSATGACKRRDLKDEGLTWRECVTEELRKGKKERERGQKKGRKSA